jgi:hypothetical protein
VYFWKKQIYVAIASVDEVKEKIKFYTETYRLLWITTLTAGGGTVGLLLREVTLKRLLFALAGAAFTISSGEILRRVYRSIQREFAGITEEPK